MARFLAGLAEQVTALERGTTSRLESAAVGLASAFLAGLVDADESIPPQTRQQADRDPLVAPSVVGDWDLGE